MLPGKGPLRPAAALIGPDHLVQEQVPSEDLIAENARPGAHAPIEMETEHAGIAEQPPGRPDHAGQQAQISLLVRRGVLVGRQPDLGRSPLPAFGAPGPGARELFARHEGRIQIDALNLPGQAADLLRKRPDIPLDQQIFPAAEDFPLHFNRYKLPILRQFMLTSVPASRAEASVP